MRACACACLCVCEQVCRQTFFENWFLCHNSMPPHVRTFKSLFKINAKERARGQKKRWEGKRERERARERVRGKERESEIERERERERERGTAIVLWAVCSYGRLVFDISANCRVQSVAQMTENLECDLSPQRGRGRGGGLAWPGWRV